MAIALVFVGLALVITIIVLVNTHSVITITTKDYGNYRIWRHAETKTELGTAHGDGESIRVSAANQFATLPPGMWDLAEKQFMKMIHAHFVRKKGPKRIVWIADKHLPKLVIEWQNINKRSLQSWI